MKRVTELVSTAPARHWMRALIGVATAMGLAAGMCTLAHANIVVNGGFESGTFTGWFQTGNTGFTGASCPGPGLGAFEGNCFAFAGPIGSDGGLAQTVSTVAGQSYHVSFAFRSDGAFPSHFSALFGSASLIDVLNPPASAFQLLDFFAVATAANTTLSFNFRDDSGFLFLDAVSVDVGSASTVPEPGITTLLSFGLIGLLLGRRKSWKRIDRRELQSLSKTKKE